MDKTKIYLDLSKCKEEERKSLPQILEKAGQEIYFLAKPTLLSGKLDMYYPYLVFSRPSPNVWVFSHNKPDRTELTYPEFIKLFEGGESKEVLQVENNYQDLKESHSELFRRLNQLRNRYKLDNLDKCLCRAKEINRKYANNEGFKIIQSDKNNVFFLDDCIFTYCPTPNECKNGGCLSKSNNQ